MEIKAKLLKYEDLQKICKKINIPIQKASKNHRPDMFGKILPFKDLKTRAFTEKNRPLRYKTIESLEEFRQGIIFKPKYRDNVPPQLRVQPEYNLSQFFRIHRGKDASAKTEAGPAILKIQVMASNENQFGVYIANNGKTTLQGILFKNELKKSFKSAL